MTQYVFKRVPAVGEAVDPDDLEALNVALEGDYSTWSLTRDSVVTSGQMTIAEDSGFSQDETTFRFMKQGDDLWLYDVATGTITALGKNVGSVANYSMNSRSILGKYHAFTQYSTWKNIYILKQASLIQTIAVDNVTSDEAWYVCFSPSGKYLMVAYYKSAEAPANQNHLRLYTAT